VTAEIRSQDAYSWAEFVERAGGHDWALEIADKLDKAAALYRHTDDLYLGWFPG
jgi:hypothetical protein